MDSPTAYSPPLHAAARVLPEGAAELLLEAVAEVALVLDRNGVIRDAYSADGAILASMHVDWVGRAWDETVSGDSRKKIMDLIAGAGDPAPRRWRQVNHRLAGRELPVRYTTVQAGDHIIAIGRDMREAAGLQQRLLRAQQDMERDSLRLRQLEARYRLLFDSAPDPILVVDTATRRITDANPSARRAAGLNGGQIEGQPFASLFHADDREPAVAMLGAVAAAEQRHPMRARLADGHDFQMSATLFRQDRGVFVLIRLRPLAEMPEADRSLASIVERIPDPFVFTDAGLKVLACNSALLDLVQEPRRSALTGTTLDDFLGRPAIDIPLIVNALRDAGGVSSYSTLVRGRHGVDTDVEVSAITVTEAGEPHFAFTIRPVRRLPSDGAVPGLSRSVEQLTELVGRVPLKDIVRESTDLIERLCIEAALAYTRDNRASAAEILGLSRQSLYSKLHRHGLGNLGADPDDA